MIRYLLKCIFVYGYIVSFQDCLSDAANDKFLLGELHLLLAKCHRGKDDLKAAILSCESSIEARPQWKDPYLYRSACFQALHQFFQETDGDHASHIGIFLRLDIKWSYE